MDVKKPSTISEYKKWFEKEKEIIISSKTQSYFDAVVRKAASDFENHDFWKRVADLANDLNQKYYMETGYYLFLKTELPTINTKSFDSFFLKTYRENVLNNDNWPEPPYNGWILPGDWFSIINDIVRTSFVVKYLDGVSYFANALIETCEALSLEYKVDYEAKEEGYYAAHFYTLIQTEIPMENWNTEYKKIFFEIQITTQLQEVLKKLLHKYYEKHRKENKDKEEKAWQWNYKSEEFSTNYLGHILHYIEGMIMEIRDKK